MRIRRSDAGGRRLWYGWNRRFGFAAVLTLTVAVLAGAVYSGDGVDGVDADRLTPATPSIVDRAASAPSPFYEYEIVARGGGEGDDLLSLSPYPSINDRGVAAFLATTGGSTPRNTLFLTDEAATLTEISTPYGVYGAAGGVEINNDNQVVRRG